MNPINTNIATTISASGISPLSPSSATTRVSQPFTWESIESLVSRRTKMVAYLRNIYISKSLYFNTVRIFPSDIRSYLEPTSMKKRTANLFYLGISLAHLLSTHLSTSYIRGLQLLMLEFEYEANDKNSQKMGKLKKKKPSSREEQDLYYSHPSFLDTGVYTQLITPNLPFELDYIEVFHSLMEILIETYLKFLQWKPKTRNLSPVEGFDREDSLSHGGIVNDMLYNEAILKLDAKFMKLIATFTKELDEIAKKVTKDAFAELDPLIFLKKNIVDEKDEDETELTNMIEKTTLTTTMEFE